MRMYKHESLKPGIADPALHILRSSCPSAILLPTTQYENRRRGTTHHWSKVWTSKIDPMAPCYGLLIRNPCKPIAKPLQTTFKTKAHRKSLGYPPRLKFFACSLLPAGTVGVPLSDVSSCTHLPRSVANAGCQQSMPGPQKYMPLPSSCLSVWGL